MRNPYHRPRLCHLGVPAIALALALFLLTQYFSSASAPWRAHRAPAFAPYAPTQPGDKIVVMAKLAKDDTSWVGDLLPDWQQAIYVVDDPTAPLHTPANKGREAMAYLTYLIDHYPSPPTSTPSSSPSPAGNNTLPSIIAFLHSHPQAWHNDPSAPSNPEALVRLRLGTVLARGYVNLRCAWKPGCLEGHRRNKHVTRERWEALFPPSAPSSPSPSTSSSSSSADEGSSAAAPAPPFPSLIGAACCAQFAVSRDAVLRRPKADYVRFRAWLLETGESDAVSGRVFEFLWHVIFGMEAVHCPDEGVCRCEVYGECGG